MRTAFFLSVLLAGAVVQASAAPIALTISGSSITASGVTPGGSVYFFGVAHERRRFTPVVRRAEKIVIDADGDGMVVFDYGKPVPPESVWAAIDLADGRRVTGIPGGGAAPLVLTSNPIAGGSGQFVVPLPASHLLVVRPSVGVWGQVLVAGSRNDTGAAGNEGVRADLGQSIPAPGLTVGAPAQFENGDVVVVIDPVTLRVYAAAVGANP